MSAHVVVIGVGNALRGDDAAGLAVAEEIRTSAPEGVAVRVCEEEPTRLIDAFGPERLIWASDIGRFHGRMGWEALPAFSNAQEDYVGKHTYAESLSLFRDTNELDQREKELILSGTARRILGRLCSAELGAGRRGLILAII